MKVNFLYINGTHYKSSYNIQTDGMWRHYAIVQNGNETRFFVDGSEVDTVVTDSNVYSNTNGEIGGRGDQKYGGPSNESWLGMQDDVRIYNINLLDSDVMDIYNNTKI